MINFRLIYKALGSLLFIEAFLLLCCLAVSALYGEDDLLAFALAVAATTATGLVLRYAGRHAENSMGRRDAYLLVTLTWTVFSLLGAMPFVCSGYIPDYTDAFFETVSGFTTTGASIINHIDGLPKGLLFWRSLTQWIGGLGIVFFTIAVLPSLVGGSTRVFSAEATGPLKTKIHPRLSTNAKALWVVFLLITVLCAVSFRLLGMDTFDSLNYAMSIAATGGFATHDASIAFFNSPAIEMVATVGMFLAGTNFTLLYLTLVKGKTRSLLRDPELRFYLTVVTIATLCIAATLYDNGVYAPGEALRHALFQVVSFISTTGLFSVDSGLWPHITWIFLTVCMFFGACAGSTSGGFKCIRGVMFCKFTSNELKHIIHPRAVLPVKIGGHNVPATAGGTLLVFTFIYVATCLVLFIALSVMGIEWINAFTMAISCASNVGPTLGLEYTPTMSWSTVPTLGKWLCAIVMLMGRLEFFSLIVLFTRSFWKEN